MFKWPMLSTVLGVATNFFFLSIIAVFSWFAYVLRANVPLSTESRTSQLSGKISAGEQTVDMFAALYMDLKFYAFCICFIITSQYVRILTLYVRHNGNAFLCISHSDLNTTITHVTKILGNDLNLFLLIVVCDLLVLISIALALFCSALMIPKPSKPKSYIFVKTHQN